MHNQTRPSLDQITCCPSNTKLSTIRAIAGLLSIGQLRAYIREIWKYSNTENRCEHITGKIVVILSRPQYDSQLELIKYTSLWPLRQMNV